MVGERFAAAVRDNPGVSTALVTGATAGIGAEFARQLAGRRYDLVLVARDAGRLQEAADRLSNRHGVSVEVVAADLTDRSRLDEVAERLADRDRPVDVLVNNAGFGLRGRFLTTDVADEQRMVDLLVTATMRLTHAAVAGMVERGRGVVVNVSSVAAWTAGGTYSAAKSWQTVFSESLSRELVGTGVHVTALAPGYTHTEFHDRAGMDVSRLPEWLWLDVEQVVAAGLRDAGRGTAVSVPGLQYKVLGAALQLLPRALVRQVTGGPARNGLRRKA